MWKVFIGTKLYYLYIHTILWTRNKCEMEIKIHLLDIVLPASCCRPRALHSWRQYKHQACFFLHIRTPNSWSPPGTSDCLPHIPEVHHCRPGTCKSHDKSPILNNLRSQTTKECLLIIVRSPDRNLCRRPGLQHRSYFCSRCLRTHGRRYTLACQWCPQPRPSDFERRALKKEQSVY